PAGNALVPGPAPNPWGFTISNDGTGPIVTHTPSPAPLPAGQDVTLNATITDLGSGVLVAYVNYRRGGDSVDTEQPMARQTGNVWQGVIPSAAVGGRGLSYAITSRDSIGNLGRYPATGRVLATVQLDSVARPAPLPAGSYRMVSVPFASAGPAYRPDVFADDLGAYDPARWRIFRWQSGAYAENSAVQDIVPGRAYWLIAKGGGTVDVLSANTLPDSACSIPLAQGWNMVGDPFGYAVNLSDVWVHDSDSSFRFTDTDNMLTERRLVAYDGGYTNAAQLAPWAGYWVRALASGVRLEVPARAAAKSEGGGKEEGWSLAFAAECGAFHDRDNRAAVTPRGARDDASEPPAMGPHVTLAFDRGGARLAEDCRADIGAGQSWRFTVETDLAGQVELSWREQGVNGGWQYQVFDVTAGRALEQGGSYAFQPEPGRPREFAVLVGSAAYIAEESGNAGLVPAVTALSQNRPNPFAGATTISYQLAGAGRVTLKLYNVAGQLVRVLEDGQRTAGRYALRWDGRDGTGRALPNGLYFYRLEAPGLTATRKLTLVR
ncbi:T9SS type A sorting domain-containing protein, partial [bacterium]|nr:T9SS type A sorting domain-containing protein [bacterium]